LQNSVERKEGKKGLEGFWVGCNVINTTEGPSFANLMGGNV